MVDNIHFAFMNLIVSMFLMDILIEIMHNVFADGITFSAVRNNPKLVLQYARAATKSVMEGKNR